MILTTIASMSIALSANIPGPIPAQIISDGQGGYGKTISTPDVAITFDDEVSASATAPEPLPEPAPEPTQSSTTTDTTSTTDATSGSETLTSRSETRTTSASVPVGEVQQLAASMLAERGWSSQWDAFSSLVNRESGWNIHAVNASSGACGLPQALPCNKLSSAGADYWDNPATQITWMLNYIAGRYGDPNGAWAHSQATGWY